MYSLNLQVDKDRHCLHHSLKMTSRITSLSKIVYDISRDHVCVRIGSGSEVWKALGTMECTRSIHECELHDLTESWSISSDQRCSLTVSSVMAIKQHALGARSLGSSTEAIGSAIPMETVVECQHLGVLIHTSVSSLEPAFVEAWDHFKSGVEAADSKQQLGNACARFLNSCRLIHPLRYLNSHFAVDVINWVLVTLGMQPVICDSVFLEAQSTDFTGSTTYDPPNVPYAATAQHIMACNSNEKAVCWKCGEFPQMHHCPKCRQYAVCTICVGVMPFHTVNCVPTNGLPAWAMV